MIMKKYVFCLSVLICLFSISCQKVNENGIEVSFHSSSIPFNENFKLEITLGDKKFKNISPEQLAVEAIMPAHGHGMNVEPMIKQGDSPNSFLAEGMLFHMRGDWQIIIYVNDKQQTQKAVIDVSL